MKIRITANVLLPACLGLAASSLAQDEPNEESPKRPPPQRHEKAEEQRPEANRRHNGMHADERVLLLKRMMDLPPERLEMLQATIRRIQSLSPEEKTNLRKRLDSFGRMSGQEQRRLLEAFRDDERKRWADFQRRHKHLPPDQRKREQSRIHLLPPHERRAYFEQLRRNKHPKGGAHAPPHPPRRDAPPQEETPSPLHRKR